MNFIQALYNNIGGKLRVLAKVIGVLGLVLAVIGLLLMMVGESAEFDIGLVMVIAGPVLLLCSWPVYGFGQLVDDVHEIRSK